ncbi:MAG: hypothetical protein J0649_08075 [Methylococcales bacterium]|jgi:pSer/pThr/pTyr-binding forkhead associated (FHA) protein|nr:hypothetical protein [Methylococcales bacterium]
MLKKQKFIFYPLWFLLYTFSINALSAAIIPAPTPFSFLLQTDVKLNSLVASNYIAVDGLKNNTKATISIKNGKFSINDKVFRTSSTTVVNGDRVRLQHTSAKTYKKTTITTLKIGSVQGTFSTTTIDNPKNIIIDTTPDTFAFTAQVNLPLNKATTSNTIIVTGINAPAAISIVGGEYAMNNGDFSSKNGSVNNSDKVTVRIFSASTYQTKNQATLTIGGVSSTLSATTLDTPKLVLDTMPDTFNFVEQVDLSLNTRITSNTITVTGINTPTAISIVGGEYAMNNGDFSSKNGSVNNSDKVTVRIFSASTYQTKNQATLTIGGVSATFNVSTMKSTDKFLLPATDGGDPAFYNKSYFQGPVACANCHDNLVDSTGKDVSIQLDWSATMMANASRDPFWKAKVRSELTRNPQLASTINDKCSRCHAPMANFEAKKDNTILTQTVFDDGQDGLLNPLHPNHDAAMSGVGCTLCHQIQNADNLGKLTSFTGGYTIGDNMLLYGQYEFPVTREMIRQTVGYTPTFSKHVESSKLCGTCHNLKTPFVDQFGKIVSTTPETEFPEQMPYTEWEQSNYAKPENAKECQDCHMPRSDNVKIATIPQSLSPRDNFRKHDFVGANKLMLDIFNNNKKQLGVLASTADFNESIEKTQSMLNSAATISTVNSSLTNSTLTFTLNITSTTGHKLPTAYPSRRVILHVKVKDATNKIVFESGRINPDGSIEGVDADSDNSKFEPHYDVIDSEDKVQIYEAIMGNNQNEVTYTLLRGKTYLKDNRLLPAGFNKSTAPQDVKVVGDALNDANFIGGSDQVSYSIKGLTGKQYTIDAELIHQPISYPFAHDLFKEPTNEGDDFKLMFDNSNFKSNQITSLSFNVLK